MSVLDPAFTRTRPGHVAVAPTLEVCDLIDLLSGRITALRIPEFANIADCDRIVSAITPRADIKFYGHAPKVGRLGRALVETAKSADMHGEYFATAVPTIRDLRHLCAPLLTPFDRLRLVLDEIWPAGAHLANLDDGKAFAGLIRIFDVGGAAEPHQDLMARSVPHDRFAPRLIEELAVNIYLQTETDGGSLDLWNIRPSDDEYVAMRDPGSYGIGRAKLPPTDAAIAPRTGDLIFFRATNLHAVSAVTTTPRITWSSFIGYSGTDQPLVFWS